MSYIFFLVALISQLFINHYRSEVYTVGDDEGWSTGQNYLIWSQKFNFTAGDVLLFKYVEGQHNVKVVTEATYRSCDTTAGVITSYESGNDRVELTPAGSYWFVCSVKGHCKGGMRFGITVANASSSPPVGSVPPPPPSTPAGGAPALGGLLTRWWWVACVVAFL